MNIFWGNATEKNQQLFFSFTGKRGNRSNFDVKANWLGNVMVVVSDRKIPVDVAPADGIVDYYTADVVSATDYFPFGSPMPGRSFNANSYRFGFNGKEKDDEIKGSSGTSYDYGFRIYDPRVGRFLSVDPIAKEYPYYSPYHFAGNSPIKFIDLDGLEPKNPELLKSGAKIGVTAAAKVKEDLKIKTACNIGVQKSTETFTSTDIFASKSAKEITLGLEKGEFKDFTSLKEIDVPSNSSGELTEYLKPLQDLANAGYFIVGGAEASGGYHVVSFVSGVMEKKPEGFAPKSGVYSAGKTPQVLDTGREGEFASTPLSTVSGRKTIENMKFYIYNPNNETGYKKVIENSKEEK